MSNSEPIPGKAPLVVLVGAPNVGKSTLFNRLVGARRAIVTDRPGITRDRIYGIVRVGDRYFRVCDTGGLLVGDPDAIAGLVRKQTQEAIEEADLLLFVLDARRGPSALDQEIAQVLRVTGTPVVLAVNKVDTPGDEAALSEFHGLGWQPPLGVSAEHGVGITELLARIEELLGTLPVETGAGIEETGIAVVGRPNVGKSSLLNRLLGEDRLAVSEIPGTTRDAVDTLVIRGARRYRFVDTAGLRRRGRPRDLAEVLSAIVARRSIERADVVVLVLDASEPLTAQDQTVGGYAWEARRPMILLANKWDLVPNPEQRMAALRREIADRFRFVRHAPLLTVSALTGLRADHLFSLIDQVDQAARLRVSTPELNRFLRGEIHSGRGPKLHYITQTGVRPPTFVVFTHDAGRVHFSLRRRLENRLREHFQIGPTPLVLRFRSRSGQGARG